jgi:ribosomal protein L22
MADEKDPKQDEAPKARKPRVRRKAKAEPAAAPAAAAEAATPEEATAVADEPTAAAEETAAKPAAKADKPAAKPTPAAAAAETAEDAPKPKRRPSRRKATADAPAETAPARKRPSRDYGDTPPMVRAHAKYVRTSARKARLVCDHIRGKSVEEARAILMHANRDVARDWSKLLESAVANAEHNHELIGDELRIHAIKADEGPTLKRFRPRAMGRATKIRKRTSHLSITLTPKDGER